MTYATGSPITAADFNTFTTSATGMNEVYADNHPGATTLPDAGFGYGQTPLVGVSAATSIAATGWASFLQTIRKSGSHQGTTFIPPLPVTDPVAGDDISAYNTTTPLATIISTLHTNRFTRAVGQSTLTVGADHVQPVGAIPWTDSLTFTYQVDFGSWDAARHFFNSGGTLLLNGEYAPSVTPEDAQWVSMLTDMSPLSMNYTATAPGTGAGGTAIGFYGLTDIYQSVYHKTYGTGTYSASYIDLSAKLAAVAGTNGLVDFRVMLVDEDAGVSKEAKTSVTTYRIDNARASGSLTIAAPSIASVGANSGFTAV